MLNSLLFDIMEGMRLSKRETTELPPGGPKSGGQVKKKEET